MRFTIIRIFSAFLFLGFSLVSLAQETTAVEGTWVVQPNSNSTARNTSQQLDSISFKNQNYQLFTGTDSLNSSGKFILQGDFLALYPSGAQPTQNQFEVIKQTADGLSLKNKGITYDLLAKKEIAIATTNTEIPKDIGFSLKSLYRGAIGMIFILGFCFLLSKNKKQIDWRLVLVGITLQLVFAISVLKFESVAYIFDAVSTGVVKFLNVSEAGAEFVFGNFIDASGSWGYVFAFKVLPTIVFFSAFTSLLYYLGVLQKVVYVLAWIMSKTMRLSGAESLAAAANIFIGQTEAPLVVKPYLEKMTKSEMLCLMVGGMATIAGGVLAAFIGFLGGESEAQQILFTNTYLPHLL